MESGDGGKWVGEEGGGVGGTQKALVNTLDAQKDPDGRRLFIFVFVPAVAAFFCSCKLDL